ncbi:hypothetical protein QC761_0050710 [Podospora bellae-mahoneyi]|uniref:Uncharacterized protein n=1 Tax=Podospora bellae-mahoneyi TaxID=2093777 RepID=A0ABR0FMA5_9PEZI|nr:hypothetical protein QC761_0050710 [Podospora bellae-mahoneyi]
MPTTPWRTLSHCFIKPPLRSKLGLGDTTLVPAAALPEQQPLVLGLLNCSPQSFPALFSSFEEDLGFDSLYSNRKRSNHGLADAADRALTRTLRNFAPKFGLELGWGFTART